MKEKKPKKSYRDFLLNDELDRASVSTEDDHFFELSHVIDSDLDYDEYSSDEIDAEEVKLLEKVIKW